MKRIIFITRIVFIAPLLASSLSLAATCTVTPPDATIGQYDPITNAESGVKALFYMGISCSAATSFTVTAGPSSTSGSITTRKMVNEFNANSTLNYQLCLDPWGSPCNTIFGTPPQGQAMTGKSNAAGSYTQISFQAQVLPRQPAIGGWYNDYVQITVSP